MGDHAQDCINESIDFEFEFADDVYNMSQADLWEKYGSDAGRVPEERFIVTSLDVPLGVYTEALMNSLPTPDLDECLCQGFEKEVSQVASGAVEIKGSTTQARKTLPDFIKGDYGDLTDRQIELYVCQIDKSNLTHTELLTLAEHSKKYIMKWNMLVGMVKTVLAGGVLSDKQKSWLSTNIIEAVDDFPRLCQNINYRNKIVAMRDYIVRSAAYK